MNYIFINYLVRLYNLVLKPKVQRQNTMNILQKIKSLLNTYSYDDILGYLESLINQPQLFQQNKQTQIWHQKKQEFNKASQLDLQHCKQQKINEQHKNWLSSQFDNQKIQIINYLQQHYDELYKNSQLSQQIKTNLIDNLQELIIKVFSKGFINPSLSINYDLSLMNKIITNSNHTKYLFILYQQNISQINLIYNNHQYAVIQTLDKVLLKTLSMIPSFIKLITQPILQDIINKFNQFYQLYDKISQQENIINQPNLELTQFYQHFIQNTLTLLQLNFNFINKSIFQTLKIKKNQINIIFQLFKLLFHRHHYQEIQSKIKLILNLFINQLNISLLQNKQIPSFIICDQLQNLKLIYQPNIIFYHLSNILIKELPNRPQYSQIPSHLHVLLKQVCEHLYFNQNPIQLLSFNQNHKFYIELFERFSILMGLLNKQKDPQKHSLQILNYIFNKKNMFINPILSQILWRQLMLKHDDMNFRIFCMGQYKKVLLSPIKQLQLSCIHILTNGFELIYKLVCGLQANSNAQFIGYHITLIIYYLSCLKKLCKYYLSQNITNKSKNRVIFCYFFNQHKVNEIKQKFKFILYKMKQSLKDRLQVLKMKNKDQVNDQKQKQTNQISICIYRIQQEIKFD